MKKPGKNEMVIMLPHEVVTKLADWHGGQSSATYSLMSTGMHHLVSISMIEKAIHELERSGPAVLSHERGRQRKKIRRELDRLIGDLDAIAAFPEEFVYIEENPTRSRNAGKRVKSMSLRAGTRVVFDPTPASMMLYSRHPPIGDHGTVISIATGRGKSTHKRGPGGGLIFVDWDNGLSQGTSMLDLKYE